MSTTGNEGESNTQNNDNSCNSTGGFIPSEDTPIHLTDAAVKAVKLAIDEEGQPGDGLRVSVVGGGCSGFEYNLDFDKEERMGDVTLKFGEIIVFIDPMSASYLKGTVIDYVTGLNGQGFKFNNPNARRTCGCGNSFS